MTLEQFLKKRNDGLTVLKLEIPKDSVFQSVSISFAEREPIWYYLGFRSEELKSGYMLFKDIAEYAKKSEEVKKLYESLKPYRRFLNNLELDQELEPGQEITLDSIAQILIF